MCIEVAKTAWTSRQISLSLERLPWQVQLGLQQLCTVLWQLTRCIRFQLLLVSAVVCAGIKSVLDIPRTLEFLETQGVTVASFGAGEFDSCTKLHVDML